MKATELELDGKKYQLGYNFNDLVDAELVTGCNLLDAMGRNTRDLSATQLRALLYALLKAPADAPKMKDGSLDQLEFLKYCGNMLRLDTIGDVRYAITEAFARSVNDELGDQVRAEFHDVPNAVPNATPDSASAPDQATVAQAV